MKRFLLLTMVIGLALAVQGAWALTLQGQKTMGYGWQSDWKAENDGNPYWDNKSKDGRRRNIGFQTFISNPKKNYKLPYWGDSSGNPDLNVFFYSPGTDWASIVIEIAKWDMINTFGVYAVDPQDDYPTEIILFEGPDSAGKSKTFNPKKELGTRYFGFFLKNDVGKWYTQASKNPEGQKDHQHFAFFNKAPGMDSNRKAYYIAAEDTPFFRSDGSKWSDRDYNDMVVYVANIPDASTWMLFLSGVPAVLMLRRRKA